MRLNNQTLKDINRAFKALEALDEIRAEIEALSIPYEDYEEAYVGYDVALGDVIAIIDKYTKGDINE